MYEHKKNLLGHFARNSFLTIYTFIATQNNSILKKTVHFKYFIDFIIPNDNKKSFLVQLLNQNSLFQLYL